MYGPSYYNQGGDRQFVFPFLVGALTGGAAVGLTRPRPIYNVAPGGGYYGGPAYYNQPPYYGGPYGYHSYGYYFPYGR